MLPTSGIILKILIHGLGFALILDILPVTDKTLQLILRNMQRDIYDMHIKDVDNHPKKGKL